MIAIQVLTAHAMGPGGLRLDADVLTDPIGWLIGGVLHTVFGSDQADTVRRTLDGWMGPLLDPAAPSSPFRLDAMCPGCGSIYDSLRPLGLFALALAILARIAGHALRSRQHGPAPVHLLSDAGIRLLCGVAALQVTFPLLDWLSIQSVVLAGDLSRLAFDALLRSLAATNLTDVVVSSASSTLSASTSSSPLLFAAYIAYLGVVVVASRAALIFCVLGAPFSVPVIAFSDDAQLVVLWLRLLVFSLALPAAAVLCLAMTLAVAAASVHVVAFPGVDMIAVGAAIWLSVKVINGLLRETMRGARSGITGTLGAAGLMPVARGATAIVREARRDLQRMRHRDPGRKPDAKRRGDTAPDLKRSGETHRDVMMPPAPGVNPAFDIFVAKHLQEHRTPDQLAQVPISQRKAERVLLYSEFLARETGLAARPGVAA